MSAANKPSRVLVQPVNIELFDCHNALTTTQADLFYDPNDPFAVSMVFSTGSQRVRWTFGRELLVDGLYEPTGHGDVLVWPCLSSTGRAVVVVELCSPDGQALMQLDSRAVRRFVSEVVAMVPVGHEGGFVDLDSALVRILEA